jgi:hypothetical protein
MLASRLGLRGAEAISGVVCLVGLVLTLALLPEPMGMTLEDLEAEAYGEDTSVELAAA